MYATSPRCQVVPLSNRQVAFVIDGIERLRWHAANDAPRPYFFPLVGPSGVLLTRMGHPGAPNHDHHRSIWFAHHKVLGIDFWSDDTAAVIRQSQWLAYEDSDEAAYMAVELHWLDGHDPKPLVTQQLITTIRPTGDREILIDLQSTFHSTSESLELQQTNFGVLAVRVAKSISAVFGGGRLSSAEGSSGEKELFGKSFRWLDYSGPVDVNLVEGITYFDHPQNITFPSKWHVRDDGWMCASPCFDQAILLKRESPLILRYMLHVHSGDIDRQRADEIAAEFYARPMLQLVRSEKPHHEYEISEYVFDDAAMHIR